MKNLFFFFLMMITTASFTQVIQIDTISFIKAGMQEVNLDTSVTNHLEAFTDKDDAIIYLYRLSSMVGAMVKWQVEVDKDGIAKLGQKEYIVSHINTTQKSHYVTYPDMRYNYINFKPNHYYMIRMKGWALNTGYLDTKAFSELKPLKRIKYSTK